MADINLLGSDSNRASSANNGLVPRVVARLMMIFLIVAVAVYAGLFLLSFLSNRSLSTAQKQIDDLQTAALASKDRNELVTRQEQLQQLNTLIDRHVYWSYMLPELARVTLKSARYSEISATADGKMELGVLLPSYSDIEKFMQIFDLPEYNKQFSNVRIVGIDNTQNGTTIETKLRLELTFDPKLLKDQPQADASTQTSTQIQTQTPAPAQTQPKAQ